MKTMVVYDSIFGNTERIALAIGSTVGPQEKVLTRRAGDVRPDQLNGLGLLIVGSPTRAFRPTKAVKSFLGRIPDNALEGVRVSSFDTRIALGDVHSRVLNVMVKLFGYAAKTIADKLVQKGGALTAPPEGFFVQDSEGPLKDGEIQRAEEWAKIVASSSPVRTA